MNDALFDTLVQLPEEDPKRSEIYALFGARSMSVVVAALMIDENRDVLLGLVERILSS